MILRRNMPGQSGAICKNAIVFEQAVVGDVDTDHQKISRTDPRHLAFTRRAMNRHIFADQVLVADDEAAYFAFEINMLRFAPEGCVFGDAIPFAEGGVAFDDGMRCNLAPCADRDILFDHRVGTDLDIGGKVCARADDGGWMNCHEPTR